MVYELTIRDLDNDRLDRIDNLVGHNKDYLAENSHISSNQRDGTL